MLIPPRPGCGLARTFKETSEVITEGSVGGEGGSGAGPSSSSPNVSANTEETTQTPDAETMNQTDDLKQADNAIPATATDSITIHDSNHKFDFAADMAQRRKYRVTEEQMTALREAAVRFEGTHNFHNYTVGRDASEKSCWRHMKKIEVRAFLLFSFDLGLRVKGSNKLIFGALRLVTP